MQQYLDTFFCLPSWLSYTRARGVAQLFRSHWDDVKSNFAFPSDDCLLSPMIEQKQYRAILCCCFTSAAITIALMGISSALVFFRGVADSNPKERYGFINKQTNAVLLLNVFYFTYTLFFNMLLLILFLNFPYVPKFLRSMLTLLCVQNLADSSSASGYGNGTIAGAPRPSGYCFCRR